MRAAFYLFIALVGLYTAFLTGLAVFQSHWFKALFYASVTLWIYYRWDRDVINPTPDGPVRR
jgi:hypothetical protein